jgi:hypothetical protein
MKTKPMSHVQIVKDISIDEIPVITLLDACEDGA